MYTSEEQMIKLCKVGRPHPHGEHNAQGESKLSFQYYFF